MKMITMITIITTTPTAIMDFIYTYIYICTATLNRQMQEIKHIFLTPLLYTQCPRFHVINDESKSPEGQRRAGGYFT